jgi:hypothetical protein
LALNFLTRNSEKTPEQLRGCKVGAAIQSLKEQLSKSVLFFDMDGVEANPKQFMLPYIRNTNSAAQSNHDFCEGIQRSKES